VSFVDDSKATNVDAAEKALAAYDRIYWIAGGRAKEGRIDALAPFMGKVVHAFLVGEAAEMFAGWIAGKAPATIVGTIDRAVAEANAMAQADGQDSTVLLSPACASFDQFPNFEVRGRFFVAAVNALPDMTGGQA
jgi:UDP-N-acetylmuramoylalanine--D-glutamate ligase